MANEKEWNTAEAQELKGRSEFIKRVTDFAQYMQQEYVEGSDGERAMLICAADATVGDGRSGHLHLVMGGKATMTASLASMMSQEEMQEVFRVARIVAGAADDLRSDMKPLRRRLRTLYGMAAVAGLWTLCIVGFQVVGIANWITTVSNLLLMAYVGFVLYREIREHRRKLQRIGREQQRETQQRKEMAALAFAEMLKRIAASADDDDEDD